MNAIESFGAVLMASAVIAFTANVWKSIHTGRPAGGNPWKAGSLEWTTTSPPPVYNFLELPTVGGREPLWEDPQDQAEVTGLREDLRQVLVTKPLDAAPEHIDLFPSPTIWPFFASLAVTALFIGSIFTPMAVVWAGIPVAITLIGWFWPTRKESAVRRQVEIWEQR